ncbi:HNH endonuclease [Treponema sp.]|uniref:HNH endonuclease n=1 Tax=Treponema sp. TaxID=166 RepID=UPI00388DE253
MSEKKKYNTARNLDAKTIMTFKERIEAIEDEREREICRLYIEESMSTIDIQNLNLFKSKGNKRCKDGRGIRAATIYHIVNTHFPEVFKARKKKKTEKQLMIYKDRKKLQKERLKDYRTCWRCGSCEEIELHHMLPLKYGGEADERNLIPLCKDCHSEYTKYQREKHKEIVSRFIVQNELKLAKGVSE